MKSGKRKKVVDPQQLNISLLHAAESAKPALMRHVLKLGADVNTTDEYGQGCLNFLTLPARRSDTAERVQCLDILVEHGITLDVRDDAGQGPLHWASRSNLRRLIAVLVQRHKQDINAVDNEGNSCLHSALQIGVSGPDEPLRRAAIGAVRELIELGINPNIRDTVESMTPLMHAVREDAVEATNVILTSDKIDLEAPGEDGYTALHYATFYAAKRCLPTLLRHGANVRALTAHGFNAIEVARDNLDDTTTRQQIIRLLSRKMPASMRRLATEVLRGKTPSLPPTAAAVAASACPPSSPRLSHVPRRIWAVRSPAERAAWNKLYRSVSIHDVPNVKHVPKQVLRLSEVRSLYQLHHVHSTVIKTEAVDDEPEWFNNRKPSLRQTPAARAQVNLASFPDSSGRCSAASAVRQRAPANSVLPTVEQLSAYVGKPVDQRVETRQILDPTHPANVFGIGRLAEHRPRSYGLFTKTDLRALGGVVKKGTVIGEYVGEVLTYSHVWENSRSFRFADQHSVTSKLDLTYQIDLVHTRRWIGRGDSREEGSVLCVDGRFYGNETRFANDFRDVRGQRDPRRPQNAKYHQCVINGWPHIFVVAIRDIPADTEVLVDYGASYWSTLTAQVEEHREIEQTINDDVIDLLDKIDSKVVRLGQGH
eukprot:m.215971 g.215971  ORF g.215971 m.215971 type:complete len:652 (+) comp18648_c0_seq2:241-2196(+)